MPIELKDILTFTGIEADSIEDFKTNFENSFIKKESLLSEIKKSSAKTGFIKDVVDSATGKRMGSIAGKLKSNLTKLGIEIPEEDAQKKPVEELIEFAFETHINSTNATIQELEAKAKLNSGEQTKELADKLKKYEETNLALKSENKKLGLEINEVKLKSAEELKGVKIQTIREQAMGKIPRRSDIDQKQYGLMLTGFENTIDQKFKIDLDEHNQPFIADKKTGERFRNPAKAGEFLGIEDVLKQEALELGISPKNPFTPPKQVIQQAPQHQQNGNGQSGMPARPTATPRR